MNVLLMVGRSVGRMHHLAVGWSVGSMHPLQMAIRITGLMQLALPSGTGPGTMQTLIKQEVNQLQLKEP